MLAYTTIITLTFLRIGFTTTIKNYSNEIQDTKRKDINHDYENG